MATTFFYEDNPQPFRGKPKPYHDQPATEYWLTHYRNSLMLSFLAQNETDGASAARARHELAICERKLEHWSKHVNYNQFEATRGAERAKREWTR